MYYFIYLILFILFLAAEVQIVIILIMDIELSHVLNKVIVQPTTLPDKQDMLESIWCGWRIFLHIFIL